MAMSQLSRPAPQGVYARAERGHDNTVASDAELCLLARRPEAERR